MKWDVPWGLTALGLSWIGLILWMTVKLMRAPVGEEDERGFRVVPPKR